MAARRRSSEEMPPRPLCSCGASATHVVRLTVQRLELERQAGVNERAYWTGGFRGLHTSIETVVCDECFASKINVAVDVDATMAQAKTI